MHLAYLLPPVERYSPVSGGAIATITMQHARRLTAAGHRVSVLAPRSTDEAYAVGDVVTIDSPTRDQLSLPRRAVSRYVRKLMRWDWMYYEYYLRSFRRALRALDSAPDAVVCFNDLVTPAYVKRVVPTARVIVRLSNEVSASRGDISPTLRAVERVVAVSTHVRDWTVNHYGLSPEKITVIPNGADLDTFFPRPDYLTARPEIKLLALGRIDPNKGTDLAVDAVTQLRREGFSVRLTVAGSIWFYGGGDPMTHPYFRELKKKMDHAGANYLGHVTRHHIPQLVREHDIACILSRSNDPMPQTAFEAMASGCAVVASNRGGLPEALGNVGLLADPDDFDAVVSNLRSLASDPAVLLDQKRKSVQRASVCTWDVNLAKMEALFRGTPPT